MFSTMKLGWEKHKTKQKKTKHVNSKKHWYFSTTKFRNYGDPYDHA